MPSDAHAPDRSLDLTSLTAAYRSGEWTPLAMVDEVHRRITAYPRGGVWIDTLSLDQLRAQASGVMERRQSGGALPLYGIPFAVKDNIDVAGRATTAGCPDFAYVPAESATVVQRLLDAGAILVGKANLDQFATGLVGTRSPYGACASAFDARDIAGGSSSGSAVAVAAGLVSFALGTDTAGSGRVPAGFNNIVGLKPTRGRLSTRGVVPACRSLDCVSIFALTCDDAAAVARVAAGFDSADAYSRPAAEIVAPSAPPDPARFRFGVPRDEHLRFFGNDEWAALYRGAVERMGTLGGTPVTIDYAPFAEAAQLLYDGPWLAERLAAIKEFFASRPDALLPITRSIIGGGARFDAVATFEALYRLQALRRAAHAQWDSMDLLLVPTAGTTYTIAQVEADPVALNVNLGYYTNFVNLMDLCALAVPSALPSGGRPFGVTLVAPAGAEDSLLAIGDRYHRAAALTLGATGLPLPPATDRAAPPTKGVMVAVVGAHLAGQPLNFQLTDRKASLVRSCKTSRHYRLFALPETTPPKPGMVRTTEPAGDGVELEVWRMSAEAFGTFVAAIPPPLSIGTIELQDGSNVKGFLCESHALAGARDITHFGGWRSYLAGASRS